tara:strand:+ start:527 stop:835 length:309 start_codon:yes stop_codon:yes gene_type:complete
MTDRSNRRIFIGRLTETAPELSSECRLWRQVISQAISDAYLDDMKQKNIVSDWVHTQDFVTVCDFASVEFEQMKINFEEILSMKPALAKMKGRLIKHLLEKE